MSDNFTTYISSLVSRVLESPGYSELPDDKKKSLEKKMSDHFQKLVFDTALNRMSEEQVEELKDAVENRPEVAEKRMEEITSTIPGLAIDIEERLEREAGRLQELATK